jgi:L-arabinose transport system ATP-binding protein
LMRLLCGARKSTGGRVRLDGKPMRLGSPRAAIRQRVAMCPEDRKSEGIFPIASVGDNINVSVRRRIALGNLFVNRAREDETTKTYIERLGIRTPSGRTAIRNLSGGNQQKVILGRWLAETIDLLVLDEPTRGIDVGARSQIYDILYTLAEEGRGIIVVSSDLPEVMSIADRIVVMREGRIVGEVLRDDATPEMLLAMALPQ